MSARSRLGAAFAVVKDAVAGFSEDRAEILAAALAFYTLLSLAPLVIIAVAVAGTLLGQSEARQEVTRVLTQATSASVAETINGWVDQAAKTTGVASVIGGALLLYTASRLFEQIKAALNQVFDVDEFSSEGFKTTAKSYVLRKLFGFAMVLGAGVVLIAVFVSRTALYAASSRIFAHAPRAGTLAEIGQVGFSIIVVTGVAAVLFKIVPDTKVGWRAAWIGGLVTSILFNIGNILVGLYLARATVAATYGAAGSLVVVLLWFFYSAQILLVGAEIAHAVQCRFGRHLAPEDKRALQAAERRAAHERATGRTSKKLHARTV
jgi:membrane protein